MNLYQMTNVPVMEEGRSIAVEIDNGNVTLWNAKASDIDNREHWLRIADIYIGDHMFKDDMRDMLRKMHADDVIFALNHGIQLGYAKAQADIRRAIGALGVRL